MVVIVSADGRIVYANPRVAEVTGYDPEEMVGRDIREFGSLTFEQEAELWASISSGGRWLGEVKGRTKTGKPFWALTSIAAVRDSEGAVSHLVCVSLDLTWLKQSQESLSRSEMRFRLLYQDNPAMYFSVDSQGMVLSVNEFGANQLGYESSELVGRSVLDIIHPDDRTAVRRQLKWCIQRPGEVFNWELRKIRRSGEVMWVRESARGTSDVDGSPVVLIVCEDISELKRMEQQVQELREELEAKAQRRLEMGNDYGLSFREVTILHLVTEGKPDKEIAKILGISYGTVNKHVASILRKMGATSRTEAGVRALREGLL
jgi:PAS domain S-box-containing protein